MREDEWGSPIGQKSVSFSSYRLTRPNSQLNVPQLPIKGWPGPVILDTGCDTAFCGREMVPNEKLRLVGSEFIKSLMGKSVRILGEFPLSLEYSAGGQEFCRVPRGSKTIMVKVIPGTAPLTLGFEQLEQLKLNIKMGSPLEKDQRWVVKEQLGTDQLILTREEGSWRRNWKDDPPGRERSA